MRQEGEPSVDQILQSIKRVMAREPRRLPPAGEERLKEAYGDGSSSVTDGGQDVAPEPAEPHEALDVLDLSGFDLPPHLPPRELDAENGMSRDDISHDDLIENEADGEGFGPPLTEAHDERGTHDETADDLKRATADDPAAGGEQSDRGGQTSGLTSDHAITSVRNSLTALAMLGQPGAPLPTSAAGAASLDTLVRDMLRPMLANWLDDNLPGIVEREVRAEIGRIVHNIGGNAAP